MKHVIIGTAGHVDHGKTALIKALTGQDTDKLKEEKERGISIDLGFACLPLTDTLAASIVDVPGHERFLKNMLAGAGGIDLALLVVAADAGVRPQTVEHLHMLQLFNISHGVIAITKIDKVDSEWLELIKLEINQLTADTFLANASVVPVSSVTSQGLAELRDALTSTAAVMSGRSPQESFRLWIDRVFTVKGHGVVITGSVLSGTAAVGQVLRLEPLGLDVKVRGIECHDVAAGQVTAGQRAAINLAGVSAEQISRGMLLSCPERTMVGSLWDAAVVWRNEVKSGTRVRLHVGTGEWIGRVRRPSILPPGIVRLSLEQPMPGGAGERGILRLYSPQTLLAGVTLLGPAIKQRNPSERLLKALNQADYAAFVSEIIRLSPQPLSHNELLRAAGYISRITCQQILAELQQRGDVIRLGESYLSAQRFDELTEKLQQRLTKHHAENPASPGLPKEEARQYLELEEKWFDYLLCQQQNTISARTGILALLSHSSAHDDWLSNISNKIEGTWGKQVLRHIDPAALAEVLAKKTSEIKPIYDALLRSGELVRLGEVIVYRKTLQYNVALIQAKLQQSTQVTTAEIRDIMQTSRKIAIPVLEYCDMHKYTIREGDVRRLGSRKPQADKA